MSYQRWSPASERIQRAVALSLRLSEMVENQWSSLKPVSVGLCKQDYDDLLEYGKTGQLFGVTVTGCHQYESIKLVHAFGSLSIVEAK